MEKELCQICKHRIAEHRFVRVVGGVETAYKICSHCKAVMDNKYRELQEEAARKAVPPEMRVCAVCGTTLQSFNETGVFGCENCYHVFDDYLREYILGYHGMVTHVGMDATAVPPDVEALYKELADLVAKEEYEKAKAVNDKIKRLMGGGDDRL